MSSFVQLVRNENMKIYRRPRNWVMAAFIVFALVAFTIIMSYTGGYSQDTSGNWKSEVEQTIANYKQALKENGELNQNQRSFFEEQIKINEYRLEHNISPEKDTLWDTMNIQSSFLYLAIVFTIVVAADMIASEFTWGTIKLLLIRPASRMKILLSKYTSTLLYALFLTIVTMVTSFILGAIMSGFSSVSQVDLYVGSDGFVHERSMIFVILTSYAMSLVQLLMYVTFAFMISSAFRSASMAIALSLACMFIGNTITGIFSQYDWVKYILFANINLNQYLTGTPLRPDMTMGFSIIVLAIYFIVFHIISWLLFTKRDVAA
ncbi:ABC transporter permease [Paenibacillus sp. GCM10027626]|uniref:ABC transporter permease n=1 Tax=Paenibacillus sp. GCM10027626 TaxID=3273411 RepID=UPI003644CFDA